ncbi:MAG: right-handed parallel beta-helix repeat-containing protein [Pyrinomonadaceae bacterium]|nr:right-handed parallel beta-helix repeat-containing protein [Phycisphaerales bacterium]
MRIILGVSILCLFFNHAQGQQTYHVAPPAAGGNDVSPGSAALPWATLQRAANVVTAGDTVVVHPGTYAGFNLGQPHTGTAAAPITFTAQSGVLINTEAARFNGQSHHARINMDTVGHIVIEGFEVTGTNDQRNSKAGIRMVAPSDTPPTVAGFITIRNCHVHHNGEWGIFSGHVHNITVENNEVHNTYDEHGVYLSNSADNHVVRGNRIYDNSSQGFHCNSDVSQGGDGVTTGVLVENNIIWNNAIGSVYIDGAGVQRTSVGGGSAINFDGVQDSLIRNNLLYNNHASGISLYRIDGLLPASDNVVVNNTIINGSTANPATRWCVNISDGSTGNTLFNNILLNYHASRGSVIIDVASRVGFTSDYNIVMDRLDPDGDGPTPALSLVQWRAMTGQDVHSISLPQGAWAGLFVDAPANQYLLRQTSAARDIGWSTVAGHAAPTSDLRGALRPSGGAFDIGAYEFVSCIGDFNFDGTVTSQDFFDFSAAFFGLLPAADVNDDGDVSSQDFFDFLASFFVGCA